MCWRWIQCYWYFQGFLDRPDVVLIGAEAGGTGTKPGEHASRIASGQATIGIAQGFKSYFLQNDDGQLENTHSISAGLDYVGISPIMAHLHHENRVQFVHISDDAVIDAHQLIVQKEGVIPALETTHAIAACFADMDKYTPDQHVIINVSGRGDKDIFTIAEAYQDPAWAEFIQQRASAYAANNFAAKGHGPNRSQDTTS